MTPSKNKKLCWNCDGEVPIEAVQCPFCGSQLMVGELSSAPPPYSPPPYQAEKMAPSYAQPLAASQSTAQPTPLAATISDKEWRHSLEKTGRKKEANASSAQPIEGKFLLMTLILGLAGSVSLFFALLLLFFSERGMLTLQWAESHWIYYLVAAIPLLFFAWRSVKKLDS